MCSCTHKWKKNGVLTADTKKTNNLIMIVSLFYAINVISVSTIFCLRYNINGSEDCFAGDCDGLPKCVVAGEEQDFEGSFV